MTTFANKIIAFNNSLDFKGELPEGINIMNPFKGNEAIMAISATFYNKYYNVNHPRFVMQYKSKSKQQYINKYINAFNEIK